MEYQCINMQAELTEEMRNETMNALTEAAKPLIEFVNTHCCPHDIVMVCQGHIDLYSGRMGYPTKVPD